MATTTKKSRKIVRTYSAGVFFGQVEHLDMAAQTAVLKNARRIWYWSGAASLSELAMRGTSDPGGCKFPTPVARVELAQVIEVLDVTSDAAKSIDAVKEWTRF